MVSHDPILSAPLDLHPAAVEVADVTDCVSSDEAVRAVLRSTAVPLLHLKVKPRNVTYGTVFNWTNVA